SWNGRSTGRWDSTASRSPRAALRIPVSSEVRAHGPGGTAVALSRRACPGGKGRLDSSVRTSGYLTEPFRPAQIAFQVTRYRSRPLGLTGPLGSVERIARRGRTTAVRRDQSPGAKSPRRGPRSTMFKNAADTRDFKKYPKLLKGAMRRLKKLQA